MHMYRLDIARKSLLEDASSEMFMSVASCGEGHFEYELKVLCFTIRCFPEVPWMGKGPDNICF